VIPTASELTFSWTPATLVFGAVLLAVTTVVSFVIWKRSGFAWGTGALECLRLLIIALIAVTLNQPEWRERFRPAEKPVVAVLWDTSASMETADAIDPDDPSAPARSRAELVAPLTDPEAWAPLGGEVEVVLQSFSSGENDPESATDIGGPLEEILDDQENLRAVVLATDGDWNTGTPPARAATRLRMNDVPVFAVPAGSDTRLPDLAIRSFDVPTFAIAGKPVRIPFVVESALPRDRSTSVTMETDDGEMLTKEITLPAMGRVQDSLLWKPAATGERTLTLRIPPAEEERTEDNNAVSAPIAVRKEELRVLLVDSYPRWEYRYLRNALERDPGVTVHCLLFHPAVEAMGDGPGYLGAFPLPADLASYDVIFLGDVGIGPRQLTAEQCAQLRNQVATQAAGLVFLPGFRGNQLSLLDTELDELLPVVYDTEQPRGWGSPSPGQFELTDLGLRSLLTRLEDGENENADVWSSLPGFQWFAGVQRAKAGTEVLATHSFEANRYGRIPLIVTKTYGTGKILFMGTDGAWRWRKGVEDRYHYRFWGQVARWMAYQRNMASGESIRLFYSPDRPRTGDTLTLNANVMSPGGEPLQAATVIARITSPAGTVDSIRLQPGGESQWGLFTAAFSPGEPGTFQVELTCTDTGDTLETTLTVQGGAREKTGEPARHEVLEEITRITRGDVWLRPEIESIRDAIARLPEPDPVERRLRIWAHPAWVGVIILLLGIFWVGRKATGAV